MDRLAACLNDLPRRDPWFSRHPVELAFLHHRDPCTVDPDSPLIGVVTDAAATALGKAPPVGTAPYAADISLLVNQANIPTVLFGPGSIAQAHKPNEHIPLDHVLAAVKALALTLFRWCG